MLAAELQAFSYGYRLFKELAAGEAQVLMHMHVGRRAASVPALARLVLRLASAPGCLS